MGKVAGHSEPLPLLDGVARGTVEHNLKGVILIEGGQVVTAFPELLSGPPPSIFVNVIYFRHPGVFSDGDIVTAAIDTPTTLNIVRIGPPHGEWGGGIV